ncbi:MAG: thiamine-monophosphate kinase, partial [Planctomycetes bacterium]|nr:thiamine-monophosphate kinase [Planctomycetota bacterium]
MEAELIAHLRRRLPSHPLLRLGIGDDAAVLRMADVDECVVSVDLLTDQVDFELSEVDPRRVGRKAVAANLSDLAAMASQPLAGVVALALPRQGGMDLAVALYEGMLPVAEEFDLAIAGGDTNSWPGPLAISVTVIGKVTSRGPLTRSGARPGDRIV